MEKTKVCDRCKKPILNTQVAIEIMLAKPKFRKHLKGYGTRLRTIIVSYHQNCCKPILQPTICVFGCGKFKDLMKHYKEKHNKHL